MSINRHFGLLAVLGFLLLGSDTPAQKSVRDKLAAAKSVTCEFPIYATGTWTKGEPQAEVKAVTFSLRFIEINTDDGTARLASGFGNFDIIVRLSEGALHFIQFRRGPLYTTTIFDRESREGKLKAVHSRHEYIEIFLPGFTSRPEQYYGECEVE